LDRRLLSFAVCHAYSWELASDLNNSMEKFESAGAKLIAIGVGTSDKARILADRVSLWFSVGVSTVPSSNSANKWQYFYFQT
jgi:hypothetical protein